MFMQWRFKHPMSCSASKWVWSPPPWWSDQETQENNDGPAFAFQRISWDAVKACACQTSCQSTAQLFQHELSHTCMHTHTHTHTLDKNGSLYDPAGTESWNMQIRYETMKLTMHPTNNAGTFTRVPGGCLRWPPTPPGPRWPPALNLELERERTKEEKEREVYIYLDVTHTHTRPEPGQPWKARGRKKRTHDGQTAKNSAGGGGEQTDLRNQPTRRNGPDQKQRTHLNPTTHYGEARGEN